jgi:adenylate kinase
MKLVFVWIQGSGKWTQWKILENNFWFEIFETGGALRKIAKEDSELWKTIKNTIEAWKQVSPEMIEDILVDFIENKASWNNIIFDGLVRNAWNKATADKILWDYKVVLFELDREKAEKRLLGRKYNPKTGETFLSTFNYDPKTGDKLEVRKDDNQDSIRQRIEEFYEKTLPVIEEYESEWKLIKINADNCIEWVTKELIKKLGL